MFPHSLIKSETFLGLNKYMTKVVYKVEMFPATRLTDRHESVTDLLM